MKSNGVVNMPPQSSEYADISLKDIDQVSKSSFPLCMRHLFEKVSCLMASKSFILQYLQILLPCNCNI